MMSLRSFNHFTSFLKSLHIAMQFVPSEATINENSNAVKSTRKNVEIVSEEVSGTQEYSDEVEHSSPLREEEEEEDDDEDDDNPGEASVPRKLWKFFTS